MDNNKQTAVEWLIKQLPIHGSGAVKTFPELFEQALEMEKEQMTHIDMILAQIEDIAHGELGNQITKLRKHIHENYGK